MVQIYKNESSGPGVVEQPIQPLPATLASYEAVGLCLSCSTYGVALLANPGKHWKMAKVLCHLPNTWEIRLQVVALAVVTTWVIYQKMENHSVSHSQ